MSKTLGEKIRLLRKEQNKTLSELAKAANSSISYICTIENHSARKPSAEMLLPIARMLGVTVEFLVDDSMSELDPKDRPTQEQAFYRKYKKLTPENRHKLEKILEVLDENGTKTD